MQFTYNRYEVQIAMEPPAPDVPIENPPRLAAFTQCPSVEVRAKMLARCPMMRIKNFPREKLFQRHANGRRAVLPPDQCIACRICVSVDTTNRTEMLEW